ncbi:MAG: type II toxin-antitoxin system PemK/MazF family toxin [Anaerolineae bacterium]|nr:type II toxin-antitoxin system PemK/MazF family toxin [Anaerolineae bacterium]
MSYREITPGDIYWLALPGPDGSEPGIAHPHVVIEVLNRAGTVRVCTISTNLKRVNYPGNLRLAAGEGGLPKPSVVLVSRASTVQKTQLGTYIGSLALERVAQILSGMRFLRRSTDHPELE